MLYKIACTISNFSYIYASKASPSYSCIISTREANEKHIIYSLDYFDDMELSLDMRTQAR